MLMRKSRSLLVTVMAICRLGAVYVPMFLADAGKSDSPQSQGIIEWDRAYGGRWFIDPAWKLTAIVLTSTSFKDTAGAFPIDVRDAVYG